MALTRTYWFVTRWHWYEQFGLAAPLAILAIVALQRRYSANAAARGLALTATVAGTVAIIVASLFARTSSPTYMVARLQPLRIFQLVYILMILAVGAFLGETLLRRKVSRWIVTFALLALVMLYAERYTFPNSAHFEVAGASTKKRLGTRLRVDSSQHARRCALCSGRPLRHPARRGRTDLSSHRRAQRHR